MRICGMRQGSGRAYAISPHDSPCLQETFRYAESERYGVLGVNYGRMRILRWEHIGQEGDGGDDTAEGQEDKISDVSQEVLEHSGSNEVVIIW